MKVNPILPVIVATFTLASATLGFGAVTLAQYNFGSNLNSADTDARSTAGPITTGGGIGTQNTHWGRSSTGANDLYVRFNGTNTESIDNSYFSFTLTIESGVSYDFDSLSFVYRLQHGSGGSPADSPNLVTQLRVTSSLDNHTTNLGTFSNSRISTEGVTPHTPAPSINLSSLTNVSGTVEFRFYVTDNSDFSGNITRFDDITLTAVPEPGAALFGLIGTTLSLARRRRRD
jgi:hypothetical protein